MSETALRGVWPVWLGRVLTPPGPTAIGARPAGIVPLPEATTLLGEVMARMHASEPPVVQFVAVSKMVAAPLGSGGAGSVAGHFAAASVASLGRTLLISVSGSLDAIIDNDPDLQETGRPDLPIVPDLALPGLYHVRLYGGLPAAVALARIPRNRWPGVATHAFSLLIVDCEPLAACPAAAVLAAQCDGSILIVTAGVSRANDIQSARRQLASAGGQILGTVLNRGQQ